MVNECVDLPVHLVHQNIAAMNKILFTSIILIAVSLSAFGQQKKKFSRVTLYEIDALSPGACDHPWNMPYFIHYQNIPETKFSGYYTYAENEYQIDGKFVGVNFVEDDDWGQKRSRMTVRYKDGRMHGEATFEIAYGNDGNYVLEEKVTVIYKDGEAEQATYLRFRHDEEAPYAQVTELEPWALHVAYYQSLIWAEGKEEGKKPVVTFMEQ